jgi:hypothetical protein
MAKKVTLWSSAKALLQAVFAYCFVMGYIVLSEDQVEPRRPWPRLMGPGNVIECYILGMFLAVVHACTGCIVYRVPAVALCCHRWPVAPNALLGLALLYMILVSGPQVNKREPRC